MTRENTLIQVDLSDDLSFSNGFPHDFFSWIRINEPVYWHEPTSVTPDGEGFWVVSRYEQVNEIIRNPVLFSSDKGGDRTGGGTAIKDEKRQESYLIKLMGPNINVCARLYRKASL